MNEEVIDSSEQCPCARERGTDYSLYVAPFVAVVPKSYVRELQAEDSGDVFYSRHAHCHNNKQHRLIQDWIFNYAVLLERSYKIKQAKSESVERKIRSDTEAGVYPFVLLILHREILSEYQLYHPSDERADKKQKSKL